MAKPAKSRANGRAGLDTNKARWHTFKKTDEIIATQLPADQDLAGGIDAMNLKDLLGDTQTDCGDLLQGRLSLM